MMKLISKLLIVNEHDKTESSAILWNYTFINNTISINKSEYESTKLSINYNIIPSYNESWNIIMKSIKLMK
jgi:hypothetical protein